MLHRAFMRCGLAAGKGNGKLLLGRGRRESKRRLGSVETGPEQNSGEKEGKNPAGHAFIVSGWSELSRQVQAQRGGLAHPPLLNSGSGLGRISASRTRAPVPRQARAHHTDCAPGPWRTPESGVAASQHQHFSAVNPSRIWSSSGAFTCHRVLPGATATPGGAGHGARGTRSQCQRSGDRAASCRALDLDSPPVRWRLGPRRATPPRAELAMSPSATRRRVHPCGP